MDVDRSIVKVEDAQKDLQERKTRLKTALGSTSNDIAALKGEAKLVFGEQYLKLDLE